jgi:AbiTii
VYPSHGQIDSERLRDWARQELKGYGTTDTVPDYRRIVAAICIDSATSRGLVTGQQISPMDLPEYAHGYMTETPTLANPIGELENLSHSPNSTMMLCPSGAQELVLALVLDVRQKVAMLSGGGYALSKP